MIESVMYFGIGFLIASLIGLIFLPLVHGRAVRLTMRRLEAMTPLSMVEIQADKDQLRAEFALSARRLELGLEQMKAKAAAQLAQIGRMGEAVNKLKAELAEKSALIHAMEARERMAREHLRTVEEASKQRLESLRNAEQSLAEKEAERARLAAALDERSVTADSQRIELVALRTKFASLQEQITDRERALRGAEQRLAGARDEAKAATDALAGERARVAQLTARIADLDEQLAAQAADAERLTTRAQELETRHAEQARVFAQRERQHEQYAAQLAEAQKRDADARAELTARVAERDDTVHILRNEKARLQEQLDHANAERVKVQRELTETRQQAEAGWAAEGMENTLLRERMNTIAAEIARLTATVEGSESPIRQMLNQPAAQAAPAPSLVPLQPGATLAERMRALQHRARNTTPAPAPVDATGLG